MEKATTWFFVGKLRINLRNRCELLSIIHVRATELIQQHEFLRHVRKCNCSNYALKISYAMQINLRYGNEYLLISPHVSLICNRQIYVRSTKIQMKMQIFLLYWHLNDETLILLLWSVDMRHELKIQIYQRDQIINSNEL